MKSRISVRVIPNASRNEIVSMDGTELKIKLQAVPEKGKANKALVKYLAGVLGLRKNQVHIVHGETSRRKIVEINDLAEQDLLSKTGISKELNL